MDSFINIAWKLLRCNLKQLKFDTVGWQIYITQNNYFHKLTFLMIIKIFNIHIIHTMFDWCCEVIFMWRTTQLRRLRRYDGTTSYSWSFDIKAFSQNHYIRLIFIISHFNVTFIWAIIEHSKYLRSIKNIFEWKWIRFYKRQ